ncbi:MAG: tRNA (guanosine(37)-N1)-methyltransferase TrmD [bacterium]
MLKKFDLLTIFPKFFDSYLSQSLVGKALEKKLFEVAVHNLREWTRDKHRAVDDVPYGGGEGMVFRPEPLTEAILSLKSRYQKGRVIYLSCQGRLFDQEYAKKLYQDWDELLLVCGRYEGIDQRVIDTVIDEEVSIGDYVLAGGEVPAMVVMDALIRLIPGVLGKSASLEEESFEWGLLEYPHYTRPEVFQDRAVPSVLLSGNHAQIREWRLEQAIRKTLKVRPDLVEKKDLSEEILRLIRLIQSEKTK